ncbi:hypothetical protein NHF46_07975 [Arthrobacter alpinus]|nr:hypothetical protein [Arthrobacter alpinus]
MAQDVANLILVAPATVALVLRACRGHMLAWLWRVGVLAFTAYSYSIYLFSVHFGPLFLLWVAVLGLSVFTLVGSLSALGAVLAGPGRLGRLGRALRLPGWFLVGAALLFATMWLGEILPDLLAGTGSASAAAWRVPSNPVHVLDLAIFLPAVAASGVLLLRRSRLGAVIAPGALVFLALTCVPILVTPFVAQARGAAPGWAVIPPIGLVSSFTSATGSNPG